MKNIYILSILLVSVSALTYSSCNTGYENLKVTLSFQHHEGGIESFIAEYASKIVVTVYGNNFVPIKKSIDFPSSPIYVCASADSGYYTSDIGFCEYQLVKISVQVSVPVGTNRSVVVETLNNDGDVTFRGSKSDLAIDDNTSVEVAIKPVSRINFVVNEMTDIKSSKYEPANTGKIKAYYFERIKEERIKEDQTEIVDQATLIGEQDVSSSGDSTLEFAYSSTYRAMGNDKEYLYPSLFGYYRGDNGSISFVIPGLAESFGYGLEPGGKYDMVIFAALRDKIKENPLLTAVTPSQINCSADQSGYCNWDWMNIYLSYVHSFQENSIEFIKAIVKADFRREPIVFSTGQDDGYPFPNEVYDIGRLRGVEDDIYMGFRNIVINEFNIGVPNKSSGEITVYMEFGTINGESYKTNEIKIKYNKILQASKIDAGYDSDGGI